MLIERRRRRTSRSLDRQAVATRRRLVKVARRFLGTARVGTVRGLGIAGTDSAGVQATVELGVERLGVCELVFENDDAAGGFQGGASVDEFAGSGCHP